MPLTRELGEHLDNVTPIEELRPIAGHIVRPNRRRFWGPEMWAEMQRIYATPDPFARTLNEDAAHD